jgi:hypothetical protein
MSLVCLAYAVFVELAQVLKPQRLKARMIGLQVRYA